MTTLYIACSGVGQVKGVSDGIGALAARLEHDGHTVILRRITRERLRGLKASAVELASMILHEHQFDRLVMFGHSRGVEYIRDTCAELNDHGQPVARVLSADGWSKTGELWFTPNVERIEAWHATDAKRIHGSKIIPAAGTILVEHDAPGKHFQADECPEFVAAVLAQE